MGPPLVHRTEWEARRRVVAARARSVPRDRDGSAVDRCLHRRCRRRARASSTLRTGKRKTMNRRSSAVRRAPVWTSRLVAGLDLGCVRSVRLPDVPHASSCRRNPATRGSARSTVPTTTRRGRVETADTVDAMKRHDLRADARRVRPATGSNACSISAARPGRSSPRRRAAARTTYGIDLNPDAIAMAQRARARGRPARRRRRRPARSPACSFDAVVMIDFIEHVRDPEAELGGRARRSPTPDRGW